MRALAWEPDAHAVAQELHASADHHVPNLQSADDLHAVLADAADINRGLAHDFVHCVDDERDCSAIAFSQRRQRHHHGRGILLEGERDRCGHAEPHGLRRLFHGNANRIGPRSWVGLASNLANPPVDADAGGTSPKRCLDRLPDRETCRILLGDGDGDFRFPGLRQADDRLAGANDLARLARNRRDDAGLVGLERSVVDRVDGLAQLRLRALQRGRGRIQLIASRVVGRLGDDGFGQQDVGALEIVVCHIATAARRGYRRSRRGFGKPEIGLIQARDHLAHLDAVADVDDSRDDLAGHAKAERALDPRPHDTGIGQRASLGGRRDDGDLHRPHDLLLDGSLALAAGDTRRNAQHDQNACPVGDAPPSRGESRVRIGLLNAHE